jgi:hypothetical protein
MQQQHDLLEFLVAAEYANAQATEGLMKAFEGGSGNKGLDASLKQMARMGGLNTEL